MARVDTGDFPQRLRMAARSGVAGWQGRLWADGTVVDLAEVRSVYYRRPTRFRLPERLSDGDAVFASIEARLGVGGVLAALDPRVGGPRTSSA